jgi:type II secretory pathway pseudopilin PulG
MPFSFNLRRNAIRRRRAFTLVELLVTASILVSLSILTVSIFGSIGSLQAGRKNAENLASASRQIESRLREDIQRASHRLQLADSPVGIRAVQLALSNGRNEGEDILILRVPSQDNDGNPTQATLASPVHVYCNKEDSRTVVRMRFANGGAAGTASASLTCAETPIKTLLGTTEDPVVDQLTDGQTVASHLKFSFPEPVVASSVHSVDSQLFAVPIIRFEMRLRSRDTSFGAESVVATGVVGRTSWFSQIIP